MIKKRILDACCGSRMFWFDKQNPDVLFADIRNEEHILCDGRQLVISPDMQMDFRNMPFSDNHFKLVVFDPPHMKSLGRKSWMALKYGVLSNDYEVDLKKGFDECMRVLEANGILIFKWNEKEVTLGEVLKIINTSPLFGHTSGKHGKTIWMCFMKTNNTKRKFAE